MSAERRCFGLFVFPPQKCFGKSFMQKAFGKVTTMVTKKSYVDSVYYGLWKREIVCLCHEY